MQKQFFRSFDQDTLQLQNIEHTVSSTKLPNIPDPAGQLLSIFSYNDNKENNADEQDEEGSKKTFKERKKRQVVNESSTLSSDSMEDLNKSMCYLSPDIELAETSKRTKRSLAPKKLENNIAYNEEKGK